MKKIIIVCIVAIWAMVFTQCTKDGSCPCNCPQGNDREVSDTSGNPPTPNSNEDNNELVGTTWGGMLWNYGSYSRERALFEFESNTRVCVSLFFNGEFENNIYGTYSLNDRSITFSGLSIHGYTYTFVFNQATFTNTIMRVTGTQGNESKTWTLDKQ